METTAGIILILLICIGVFFACRELMCWYYKINKLIDLQETSVRNQERIIKLLENDKKESTTEESSIPLESEEIPNGVFRVDDLVVDIETGKPMRIKDITAEGLFSCYTEEGRKHEGNFKEGEIKYWDANPRVRGLFKL